MAVEKRDALHSIRANNEAWAAAKARATAEGWRLNSVLNEFLEGYATGALNLPEKEDLG